MEQISILHAMKLFNMKSVNCFGKKVVQDGKFIFAASMESLESPCKVFLKTLLIFKYNDFLTGLNQPIHWQVNDATVTEKFRFFSETHSSFT